MDHLHLHGKTAIVTGASSGIGRAIAMRLAQEGMKVSLIGRNRSDLDEVVLQLAEVEHAPKIYCADITQAGAIETIISDTVQERGGLHVYVNNAGLSYEGAILSGERAHWQEMFDLNVIALLAGAKAAVQAMRETACQGHIVNIGSIGARVSNGGAYGASKAAVDMISRSLRYELEDDPIRVVQIMPGAFMTNFGRHFSPEILNVLLRAMGESHVHVEGEKLPVDILERMQGRMASMFGDPSIVADAVTYAISQPITINVSEIVVQPSKSDWRAALAGS